MSMIPRGNMGNDDENAHGGTIPQTIPDPDQHDIEYIPRSHFSPFHERKERWAALVCHRRAGKTVACVNELVTRALYTRKKNARFAYVAPFRGQAKNVAWVYLKEAVQDFATKIRESDLRVELPNGAWITLYGSDNPDALRGLYLDGVVLDEYGDCRPSLWAQVILPTLADRKGWAVFIGTPKGKNHFHKIFERSKKEKGWFNLTLKASSSGILPPEEQAEMQRQMTEEEWEQEMECSFQAAILGTYYAKLVDMLEQKGQIAPGACEYDPEAPVQVACDLGYTDSCAWWFWQTRPDGIAVIDYYETNGQPLKHYVEMLIDKGYHYEAVWLPHDAKAKTLQTGRSTVEQLQDPSQLDPKFEGLKLPLRLTPTLSIQHGIDAGRLILPKCYIDSSRCGDGVEALRAYRRRYDEVNNVLSDKPLHDWSSNGSDAWRYLALVSKEYIKHELPMANGRGGINEDHRQQIMAQPAPTYNLDQLFADRAKNKPLNRRRI